MKIGILGCGNWGSVFGIIQHKKGHLIRIWEFEKARAIRVQATRNNRPFLTGYKLPKGIKVNWDIRRVIEDVDVIVFALPSQVLRPVVNTMRRIKLHANQYLSLIKGIDMITLQRPSEIIAEIPAAKNNVYVLSGPSIANEIIRGEPTAVVLVGPNKKRARALQYQFATDAFRIYLGTDIIGVELGGAIKNVLALACGISDGLGFGTNAKGAIISRGIVEMQRLGTKMGAAANTFWGLSGLGDLITTACSEESRNHRFGRELGKGRNSEQIKKKMVMVAEGVPTARAVKILADKLHIEMPICRVVYDILYKNKPPRRCLKELMGRSLKKEG